MVAGWNKYCYKYIGCFESNVLLPNYWHRQALQMESWCAKMRHTGNCRNVWIIVTLETEHQPVYTWLGSVGLLRYYYAQM